MDYVTIYSYPKVWKIENRIYGIMNLNLPVPIELRMFGYFLVLLVLVYALSGMIPAFARIPGVVRYLIFPYGAGNWLMKAKLDGKAPHRYLVSLLQYVGQMGRCHARFEACPVRQPAVKLNWYCGRSV